MPKILKAALAMLVGMAILACLSGQAIAQKRVALVIGNSAYQHAPKLTNPQNDATDVAAALAKHGFVVIDGVDLDKAGFDRKVREFAGALKGAEAGLFFYAGHGLQVAGHNYLVPVDAKAESEDALDFEMLKVDVVQRAMERSTNTNILFLDACRDNPLARNLSRAMGTRSTYIGRGLAAVEGGVGTLISFSTQPGNVASDGAGRNSPFAGALVKHLSTSTDDLSALLIAVRNDVMKETQRKQIPWEHSALTGRFFFGSPKQEQQWRRVDLEAGQRPISRPVVQAGGLFTEKHARLVDVLLEKHGLPTPDFQFEVPDMAVSHQLRRFIGVWIDESGFGGKGRKHMAILTRVDKDGNADGIWLSGKAAPTSIVQGPANAFQINGKITGDTLRFSNATGSAAFRLTLGNGNAMNYFFSTSQGQSASTVLSPVWMLTENERAGKPKAAK